jgi:hypothetical protein
MKFATLALLAGASAIQIKEAAEVDEYNSAQLVCIPLKESD